jgi:hypothetical protein
MDALLHFSLLQIRPATAAGDHFLLYYQ